MVVAAEQPLLLGMFRGPPWVPRSGGSREKYCVLAAACSACRWVECRFGHMPASVLIPASGFGGLVTCRLASEAYSAGIVLGTSASTSSAGYPRPNGFTRLQRFAFGCWVSVLLFASRWRLAVRLSVAGSAYEEAGASAHLGGELLLVGHIVVLKPPLCNRMRPAECAMINCMHCFGLCVRPAHSEAKGREGGGGSSACGLPGVP